MLSFRLESWSAIAPGLETREDWRQWLRNPVEMDPSLGKVSLNSIPPMLRRRFNTLGRCAMAAAMPLVDGIESIPSIFASRHGDTELSYSLLEGIGRDEPMSPTSFSLAVHNAVSGLFSIARKDTSEVTAIAAMEGLVLQALFEAIGQLQNRDRLLCVIYDIPLPDFYARHCPDAGDTFPYAIAMILGKREGPAYRLTAVDQATPEESPFDNDALNLLALLSGQCGELLLSQSKSCWRVSAES